jgi:ribosome-associated protein
MDDLRIDDRLVIPGDELEVRASRSGGPGGQHVNTTASRVELRWDVRASRALDEVQRDLLLERLASRLTADGVLVLQASEHRSQHRNREAALGRLRTLVVEALVVQAERRPTRPSRSARRRRLDDKRARSTTKELPRRPEDRAG